MTKLKITTIVGARPQFIKAAAISRAIRLDFSDRIEETIIHSGQHYDDNLSAIFFREMEIPEPAFHLNAGSATHGAQTGEMLAKAEDILLQQRPDVVIVYGDTNTTLAGALAASKLHIPVAHIEAGLRSFNKSMPEEVNRVMTDHVSTWLFTPTLTGFNNLLREGFDPQTTSPYAIDRPGIFHCGDVMFDNTLYFREKAEENASIIARYNFNDQAFVLCTLHRDLNTDQPDRLHAILSTFHALSQEHQMTFLLPLHPRTLKMMSLSVYRPLSEDILKNQYLQMIEPVGFLDMLYLESRARMIITDSGGVQKESYFFQKPCLVLRPESEWKELVELETTLLVDADPGKIRSGFHQFLQNPPHDFPAIFGDGHAAQFILKEIMKQFNR